MLAAVADSIDDEIGALDRDGFVILASVLDAGELAAIVAALAPHEGARPRGRNEFEGTSSTRVYSLAGKGEVFRRLAEHPRIVAILDRTLERNYLLSTLQSIRLHPGETAQPWHSDDVFYLVPPPRPRLAVSVIWAIEDFTEDNGATEVLRGSQHLVELPSDLSGFELVRATMPAGSAIVFDGRTWHRGGANRATHTRLAISPQYCQPWLRPQESQLLIVPPADAVECTPRMRSMLGYNIHPPFVGQVEGMHPLRLVDPSYGSNRTSEAATLADRVLVPEPSARSVATMLDPRQR
jgi:ectoine hydroxylase-related dioxygenase (phytanoyl-CoA dioxygenase family)